MEKFICLAIILFGGFTVFAQTERILTEDEFAKIVAGAEDVNHNWRFKSYPYKITCIYEITFDSKGKIIPFKLIKNVRESNRMEGQSHDIIEFIGNSETTGKPAKWNYESISIWGKNYERNDDEIWNQVEHLKKRTMVYSFPISKARSNTASQSNILEILTEYKYLGSEQINDQIADVYTSLETTKIAENSGNLISAIDIKKYWFSKERMILKFDYENQRGNEGNKTYTHIIQAWEKLDPEFKISAPVLPDAKQSRKVN